MDGSNFMKKASSLILKYKYALLVLLAGIALMLLPTGKSADAEVPSTTEPLARQPSVEEQLALILSQIKGAGKVEVMLTTREGEQTIYQTDTNCTSSDGNETAVSDTVLVTDENRVQAGLVRQVRGPVYQGAIVLCQGANDPTVRLAIVDAVSKITGLGADQISVLEMK